MKLFGRKRYEARQARSDHLAESYQLGRVKGFEAFQRCEVIEQYPDCVIDPQTTEGAYTIGFLGGYSSAQWEFEDETVERLEKLEAEIVAEAERITANALGGGE